jgi:hypothetical protein
MELPATRAFTFDGVMGPAEWVAVEEYMGAYPEFRFHASIDRGGNQSRRMFH